MIRHSFEAEAVFYRIIAPVFAAHPLSGMGAARQGGRFNRPGTEALYLSSDEATALAEYRQAPELSTHAMPPLTPMIWPLM